HSSRYFFFIYCYRAHRALPSFPTRRSSDLGYGRSASCSSPRRCPRTTCSAPTPTCMNSRSTCPAPACRRCTCGCRSRECNADKRSEEHTSELQSQSNLVCRLLLEKKKKKKK